MQLVLVNASKIACSIATAIMLHVLAWGEIANAAGRTTWTTGAALQQRLAQPVDILWSSIPLRGAVESLSQAQQVAILIDRRIDPGQKLDLTMQGVPMESVLQTIADRCGLGVAQLGPVVYLGPPPAAAQLRPLAAAFGQAVRRLPTAAQRKFLNSKAFVWEDLSTPRDLLAQLGRLGDVEIIGIERVPHDLWAAADLPPLSLVDRLTLIAVQFDLTFKVAAGGARLELVPVPALALKSPPIPTDGRQGLSAADRPRKPSAAESSASVDRVRIQRMSVQAEPLGPVLRQLADKLGLELRIDEQAIAAAGVSLDQRVSVKVENASVDELLRQLLKSTGLTFHRRQKVVEIIPGE